MISEVHNPYLRVQLFSRLAFFFWREEEHGHFTAIVNQHIWKDLQLLEIGDREWLFRAWVNAYGVIWLENRDRARSATATYPSSVRIPAVYNLCFSILHKIPSGEPFDGRGKKTATVLSYSDVHNLLKLCEECCDDHTIFFVLEGIADQVTHPDSTAKFSNDQKAEMSRLIIHITETQLPTMEGVQHLGYQLVSKAQGLRVSVGTNEQWSALISNAQEMTNSADRVYVLALLASYLPKRMSNVRDRLLATAEGDTRNLRAIEDRYQRYSTIAKVGLDVNKRMATRATENAFRTISGGDVHRNAVREQRLLDLAYSVDPELPMKLALLYDDDPAREQYRQRAKSQIERHELKRELADVKQDIVLRERKNEPNLAVAAWQSLGTLHAGRMIAVDIARVRDMLACASNYPLETAYPMYSWVLSNMMNKYGKTAQASQYIRDIFEGLASGASFFFSVTGSAEKFEFNPKWHHRDEDEFHAVIKVGEREKAICFLGKWFEKYTDEFVTIVDPYFGPNELWLVRIIMEANPHLNIRIVTGHADVQAGMLTDKSDTYRTAWRNICEQDPPYTEVLTVTFVGSGKTPIHDRWILSKSKGLRMGTSFNSIGNKLTEISVMDSKELEKIEYTVNKYLMRSVREENGERIAYELFELLP